MSTIKISELATSNIALTDFFAKADATGVANKNTVQELSNLLKTVDDTAFKGSIAIADVPSENGWYFASESGTYTNCGGLVINTTDNIAIIIVSGTFDTFNKIDIPVNITIDAKPTEGSTNAVESGGVFEINSKKADLVIGKNLLNPLAFTDGGFYTASGNFNANATYTYSEYIEVEPSTQYICNNSIRWLSVYDENKVIITADGSDIALTTFTTSATSKYIITSLLGLDLKNTSQLEKGSSTTTYEDYRDVVPENQLYINDLVADLVTNKANLVVGKNKHNKATTTDGGYYGANGNFTSSANYSYTDFIEVVDSQDYICSESIRFLTYYDAGKNVVSGGSDTALTQFTVPSGTGIKYCVISFNGLTLKETAQLEFGSTVTLYEVYHISVPSNELFLNEITDSLSNKSDLKAGKNNSNKDTYTQGAIQLSNGNLSNSANFYYSDFIEVSQGNYVSSINARSSCFFDLNKRVISGGTDANRTAFAIPAGCKFITISFVNATEKNTVQFEEGTVSTVFEPFKITVPASQLPPSASTNEVYYSQLDGEKWCAYGDSITQNYTWKTLVMNKFAGVTLYNRGISGTRIREDSQEAYVNADGSYSGVNPPATQPAGTTLILSSLSNQERVNTIPLDSTIVTVWGGINDAYMSPFSTIGTIADTTVATFYGAYQLMLNRIYTRVPNARIIIVNLTSVGNDFTYTNSNGDSVEDFRTAILAIAKKYKYGVANMSDSGINDLNEAVTLSDGLHPTVAGDVLISKIILEEFRKI